MNNVYSHHSATLWKAHARWKQIQFNTFSSDTFSYSPLLWLERYLLSIAYYLLKDSLFTGMYLFRNGWGLHLGSYSNKQMGMSVTKSSHSRAHGGWKGPPPPLNELCLGTSSNDYINLSSVCTHEFWNGFQSCGNTVLKYRLKAGPWCLRTNGNYFYLVIQKVHDQKSINNFFLL